jgi:hypothetical protein
MTLRKTMVLLALLSVRLSAAFAQGTISLDTHVPGVVDSRWYFPGAPASYYGQFGTGLLLNTGAGEFQRLNPTTTLQTSPASAVGYPVPTVVTVPGEPPGTKLNVFIDIFYLGHPDQGLGVWGTTITLGGGDQPPAYLVGLPAEMGFVPEPTPAALCIIGLAALLCRHKRFATTRC